MATNQPEKWNNSPPQNLIIFACAVGTAVLLFAMKFGFDAYYDGIRDQTVETSLEQSGDLDAINEHRAAWQQALDRGNPQSIDDAMAQLATRGRMGFPAIRPNTTGELNTNAMRGWNQLPQEVNIPEPTAAPIREAAPADAISPEAMRELQEALRRALQGAQQGAQQ